MSSRLEKLIGSYNKKNKGSLIKLSECPHKKIPRISTGSFSLDIAVGGGIPYGSIIEMYGNESTGKSLIALKMVKEAQALGLLSVYIDLEGTMTIDWATKLGIDPNLLYIARPKTAEDALDLMIDTAETGEAAYVILDSIAALVPGVELDDKNTLENQQMGLAARLMSKSLRQATSVLQPKGDARVLENYNTTSIILINQVREKIGVMYGSPETTPGGKAAKFYSSIRLQLRTGERLLNDKKELIGQEVKFKTVKNKTFKPNQVGTLNFSYPSDSNGQKADIDNEEAVIKFAINYGLISQGGPYFTFGEEKFLGKSKLIEFLKTKPKVIAKLKQDILVITNKG